MAKYRSGQQVKIDFTVPQSDGSNQTGLTWSIENMTKDGVRITSGTEYSSVSITEDGSTKFYTFVFTPDSDSESYYTITMTGDDSPATVFEEVLEPDWAWLMLYGDNQHDSSTPETVIYKKPGGGTLITFTLSRAGNIISRTGS